MGIYYIEAKAKYIIDPIIDWGRKVFNTLNDSKNSLFFVRKVEVKFMI